MIYTIDYKSVHRPTIGGVMHISFNIRINREKAQQGGSECTFGVLNDGAKQKNNNNNIHIKTLIWRGTLFAITRNKLRSLKS